MDIEKILDGKIKALPPGSHSNGLRAVKFHIEAAIRHFGRAQIEPDESLFIDVITRCNLAFEGSIKEAYRVLAEQDPQGTTSAEIEKFLASGNLLRKKVLDQFTRYRQEWRNPSTHDYTLDFDEDEALLAIVSVTVFAVVLCDQIESKIAFNVAAAAAPASPISKTEQRAPLLDLVTDKAMSFATTHVDTASSGRPGADYYRLEGSFTGYLSAELASIPGFVVKQNERLGGRVPDIVVERDGEKVVLELKRASHWASIRSAVHDGVGKLTFYIRDPGVVGAVALIYSPDHRDYEVERLEGPNIRIVSPQRRNKAR